MVDLVIQAEQIVNQQRFPISKFGWPLYEAALVLCKKGTDGHEQAASYLIDLLEKRDRMASLADVYGVASMQNWSSDSAFVPWFSPYPVKTHAIFDIDFSSSKTRVDVVVHKLLDLITSIRSGGFRTSEEPENNIIVYPMNEAGEKFYVRAGNHRCAVLAALGEDIPCLIDNQSLLKPRAQDIIADKRWFGILRKPPEHYPLIAPLGKWKALQSGVLSLADAKTIATQFHIV